MAKRFAIKQLVKLMCVGGMLSASSSVMASGFALWEQDGASVGNYHAGRAASAEDASTAFYNPAGITRIKNQQLVVADDFVVTDLKYTGNVGVTTLGPVPFSANAQGGSFNAVPSFHYVAPINERLGFGFSVFAPFGLETTYGRSTALQYASTSTQLRVADVSPSLGFNITKDLSVGVGYDWQRLSAQFNQTAAAFTPANNTDSTNKGRSIGYGFHAGVLYQFIPSTRVGLTYTSQVVHHLRGTSKLVGPIATNFNGGPLVSLNTNAAITLPANTTISIFNQLNPKWSLMGTVAYTQWNVFEKIYLKNVAAIDKSFHTSTTTNVLIPANYRNTWNFSVGTEYIASDKVKLTTGVGYDQTPVTSKYRNIQVPDNNRYAIALGGHVQMTKTLGLDLGWTHLFMQGNTTINPPPLPIGLETVTTNGKMDGNADIFGAQVTWDIV